MKTKKLNERKRFGRFFYRFQNGESGADLYDRITIFQDHLVRDINAGRFSQDTNLVRHPLDPKDLPCTQKCAVSLASMSIPCCLSP